MLVHYGHCLRVNVVKWRMIEIVMFVCKQRRVSFYSAWKLWETLLCCGYGSFYSYLEAYILQAVRMLPSVYCCRVTSGPLSGYETGQARQTNRRLCRRVLKKSSSVNVAMVNRVVVCCGRKWNCGRIEPDAYCVKQRLWQVGGANGGCRMGYSMAQ